jgi:hypothetical protein
MRFTKRLLVLLVIILPFLVFAEESSYFEQALHNIEVSHDQAENLFDEVLAIDDLNQWLVLLVKGAPSQQSFLNEMRLASSLLKRISNRTVEILAILKSDKQPVVETVLIDGIAHEAFLNAYIDSDGVPSSIEERNLRYERESNSYRLHQLFDIHELNPQTIQQIESGFVYNFVVTLDKRILFCDVQDYRSVYENGKRVLLAPNHAILASGEPVLTAGEIRIVKRGEKQLWLIAARSGHYRPTLSSAKYMIDTLKELGIPEESIVASACSFDYFLKKTIENIALSIR